MPDKKVVVCDSDTHLCVCGEKVLHCAQSADMQVWKALLDALNDREVGLETCILRRAHSSASPQPLDLWIEHNVIIMADHERDTAR